MKLIDKDAVVAVIEKWLGETDKGFPNDHNLGRYDMCKQMLSFINSLEVKEICVDLGDPKGDKSTKHIIDTKTLEVKEADFGTEVYK